MFAISKDFTFSAAHQLEGLPASHPCGRWHGHNYVVRVTLGCHDSDLVNGMVRDYGELSVFQEYIDAKFDHRSLNDPLVQPTAENLAQHFYTWLADDFPELIAVAVSETPKTWAEYRP